MGISTDGKISGFRKWADTHEPQKIDDARPAASEGGGNAAVDGRGATPPDQQPHRPWLVPGVGRL